MPMMYKGYAARIDYSDDDGCFVGRVGGIRDLITFHGETITELRRAFEEAVAFYLTTCAERGETPNKLYSGKVMLRLPPEVQVHATMMGAAHGKSLNQWAAEVLANAC